MATTVTDPPTFVSSLISWFNGNESVIATALAYPLDLAGFLQIQTAVVASQSNMQQRWAFTNAAKGSAAGLAADFADLIPPESGKGTTKVDIYNAAYAPVDADSFWFRRNAVTALMELYHISNNIQGYSGLESERFSVNGRYFLIYLPKPREIDFADLLRDMGLSVTWGAHADNLVLNVIAMPSSV